VGSIYGLFDPTTGTLRYIGKTKYTPAVRVKGHVGNAKAGGRTHLCNGYPDYGVFAHNQIRFCDDETT
jgi:hypothetical protein